MHEVPVEIAGNLIPVSVSVSADIAIPVEADVSGGGGGGGGGNVQASKSVSYTPSETAISDTVQPDEGYDSMAEVAVAVGAIPDDYVGSSIDRNDSNDMMISENNPPTVLAPAGYYAADARMDVPSGSATTPATSITANPTISVSSSGLITASVSGSQSVTPTVSRGWVASGTAGTVSVSGSATSQLPLYDGS